jgi:serine protease Do
VDLQVWRDRAKRSLQLEVAATTDGEVVASNEPPEDGGKLGMAVRPLSSDERNEGGTGDGLVVERVAGAAAEAGIQPGDIVLSANGATVRDVDQLRSVVASAKKHVALLVQRGDARIFVPIELS